MQSGAAQELHASAAFKKVPGTLSLSGGDTLQWRPSSDGASVSSFKVAVRDLAGLKASEAHRALRLESVSGSTINGAPAALVTFNADGSAADDWAKFKERIAHGIGLARRDQAQTSASQPGTPGGDRGTPTPKPSAGPDRAEVQLRGKVLLANPDLLALHKEVVGSNAVSDADFWADPARNALLRAERAKSLQKHGRRGPLADIKPSQNDAGELRLNLTPELIRDLFEQFPVLAQAYKENVPQRVDESAFWARYFQSRLYHRLRTSLRSAAAESSLKNDDIFDKYLREEDDQIEPQRHYNPHDALLNLASTEEDHGETGNARDWTMRAGYDRRMLPLVRRFNEHSESVLTASVGDITERELLRAKRKTGGVGEEYTDEPKGSEYYNDIVLEDLQEHRPRAARRLEMQEQQAFLDTSTLGDDLRKESKQESEEVRCRALPR